ncbi:MAG: hypothetical protein JSS66_09010 [Armatimonadetes bacterium]|nr:hypothetical protein [Armatimonadota bacterium]
MNWRPLGKLSLVLMTGGLLGGAQALAQLRVVTYNVTNYNGESARTVPFQTALMGTFQGRSARPDLFLGQEFISASALNLFVSLLNTAPGSPGDYSAAPFVNGPDTDSVCIFRTSKLVFDGSVVVAVGGADPLPPRNVMRYDLHLIGYTGNDARLSCYSSHFKAGTTQSDKDRRLAEATIIRNDAQALGHPFLIGGDFNVQDSTETSFAELTGSQSNNAGRFIDPIKTPGHWNSNSSFRFVHSQDPVPGQAGMDDRYDFILMSSNLVDGAAFDYLGNPNIAYSTTTWNDPNHSYRAWGNDGTCYNTSLTVPNNAMVGPTIAQALIDDTGNQTAHIPVLCDMRVPGKAGVPGPIDIGRFYLNQVGQKTFSVSNIANTSLWTVNGISPLLYSMSVTSGFTVPSGQFQVGPGSANNHIVTVDTSSLGVKVGTVTVTSNDPDQPVKTFVVKARVVPYLGNSGDANEID